METTSAASSRARNPSSLREKRKRKRGVSGGAGAAAAEVAATHGSSSSSRGSSRNALVELLDLDHRLGDLGPERGDDRVQLLQCVRLRGSGADGQWRGGCLERRAAAEKGGGRRGGGRGRGSAAGAISPADFKVTVPLVQLSARRTCSSGSSSSSASMLAALVSEPKAIMAYERRLLLVVCSYAVSFSSVLVCARLCSSVRRLLLVCARLCSNCPFKGWRSKDGDHLLT